MVAAIMTAFTWFAAALLPILVWPILRAIYYAFSYFLGKSTWAVAFGVFFSGFFKRLFGEQYLNIIGIVMFFAGLKLVRYLLSLSMGILGFGAVYYLFFDAFIERVYSLVVEQLLGFPPEITVWLNYFGAIDGLRLLQAVFIWIAGFKLLLWILKPPTIL